MCLANNISVVQDNTDFADKQKNITNPHLDCDGPVLAEQKHFLNMQKKPPKLTQGNKQEHKVSIKA